MLLLEMGCATAPTQDDMARLGFGEPLTIDYQQVIRNHFAETLFDPYSAVLRIGEPARGAVRLPPLAGGKYFSGYLVLVQVNAKNRMGGYTGYKDYLFVFRDDRLIRVFKPNEGIRWQNLITYSNQ
jgi:hypothetical protein